MRLLFKNKLKFIFIFTISSFITNIIIAEDQKDINHFDQAASYFAGYDKAPESHKKAMKNLWKFYLDLNLEHLQKWQKTELAENLNQKCSLFYPFSGPDVVHALTLFPICEKYVMVGLEPTGSLSNFDENKIDLINLRKGINSLLNRSFFVTSEMWGDFASNKNGLLVPILALLKRMNVKIIDIKQLYLDEQGKLSEDLEKDSNAIKILFKQEGYGFNQEIYYFRKSMVGSSEAIPMFLKSSNQLITYLKAAQYALFDYRFKTIRNFVLENSDLILQDDSGLPFEYLNNSKFAITYYGNYEGTYGKDFKMYYQKDLKRAYQTNKSKELSFSLGYGYRKINTMMIKVKKK